MDHVAVRPYVAAGTALLGAALIAVIPVAAPLISHIHPQSPAVELTASADAFLELANALDPSASTDGLLGVANNLDSFLDLFGNPTVNVVDTLAADYVGWLDLGNSLGNITDLLTTISDILGPLGGDITGAITTLDTDITGVITTLDGDITGAIGTLDSDLSSALGPLTTIANDLGAGGTLATDLSNILTALGPTGELGTIATDITGVSTTLNNLFGGGSDILTLLGYLTYLPQILAAL
jgi:hypothetical protein